MLIHIRIDTAEVRACPVAEAGPLVIDEKSTISHTGFLGYRLNLLIDYGGSAFRRRCIAQVYQRGHTQILGQGKHTVDGTSLVTSADHNSTVNTLPGLLHQRNLIYFSLATKLFCREKSPALQLLQQSAFA